VASLAFPAFPAFPAFGAPYPDEGWSVAASFDGTGDPYRVRGGGRAAAGALIDLAFACDEVATMTIRAIDTDDAQAQLGSITTTCKPGRINRATFPSIGNDTALGLDVTVDSPVRFWVKLGVPTDHLVTAR
jgi:hypothetical protein